MEFWGVEVKPGEPLQCVPGLGNYVHISQAAIGEVKKDKTNDAVLSVMIGGKKVVIGLLTHKIPQILFDLVFEKEFELSHNGKSSVYFCGYRSSMEEDEGPEEFGADEFDNESEEDSDVVPEHVPISVTAETKKVQLKLAAPKENVAINESAPRPKGKSSKVEDANLNEDDSKEYLSDSDEDMDYTDEETDDSEDDNESSEDESTPKKVEVVNKRPATSGSETPVPEKKVKLFTPAGQNTGADGKKGGHAATPYPLKQAGISLAVKKSNQQKPNFGGKSSDRKFNSDNALQSHNKAKHGSRK